MHKPFRAETVGSLLRPNYLVEARAAREAGTLDPAEFKRVEDRAVDQAIALQEGVGLDVVSDGEMRRASFIDQWMTALNGLVDAPGYEVSFHGGEGDVSFATPTAIGGKISRKRMVSAEEYSYARAKARVPLKVTLPSPLMLWPLWSKDHSADAYPDPFDLFADGLALIREEAQELATLGCTYIQIDAPDLGTLVDPEHVALRERLGQPMERTLTEGVDLINAVADIPGVTFGLHLCRGNFSSRWISQGGYESISEHVFKRATNYDTFLLEYDDARSGSFEPLVHVPDDKVVVLGLISPKTNELEPVQSIAARVEEAAKVFPREQLAVSAACGFASIANGNLISEETQEGKLKLVADVAQEVWG